jgi:pimeloyl-ACP methyl ester carboxylesterase
LLVLARFVLVPGAWFGAWAWKRVVSLLEGRGHVAYPVTLTGMGERVHLASKDVGIETVVEDVLNVIKYNDVDDLVLVGHSFAGKVAAAAADRIPAKVRLLLYVDAFRPAKVRTPQGAFDPSQEYGSPPAGTDAIPLTQKIIDAIGPDVRGADREWILSKATPWPTKPAKEPIVLSERFDSVKSAYIFCKQSGDPVDDIISGKWGKLEGPHRVIDSGHWPMVTKPGELAEGLVSLAAETG